MYIVTGAAGLIGFHIAKSLEKKGKEVILVDHKTNISNKNNLAYLKSRAIIKPQYLFKFIKSNQKKVKYVIHMGAISSTTETNIKLLLENNYEYSKKLFKVCNEFGIKFIYASSAATYGNGSEGFNDNNDLLNFIKLSPVNYYGLSKHLFDLHVLNQFKLLKKVSSLPIGLKFFNVYGPYESHKGMMSSPIPRFYSQVKKNKTIKLFKSYNPLIEDGMQSRDFVYIKDCVEIVMWFIKNKKISGIFNVGTGVSTSFRDLSNMIFKNLGSESIIKYISKPKQIRSGYQYMTKAETENLKKVGYQKSFTKLDDGVNDYIKNFLDL